MCFTSTFSNLIRKEMDFFPLSRIFGFLMPECHTESLPLWGCWQASVDPSGKKHIENTCAFLAHVAQLVACGSIPSQSTSLGLVFHPQQRTYRRQPIHGSVSTSLSLSLKCIKTYFKKLLCICVFKEISNWL